MSKTWERGSTTAWRKVRASVLLRDGHRCRVQIPGVCTGVATHAHHVMGRAVTGDDPRYIVAACQPCNLKVGDPMKAADPPCVAVTRW